MTLYEATIPARYCRPVIGYVRSLLPDRLAAIFATAGIDDEAVKGVGARLTMVQWDALMREFVRWTGRSDSGFEIGLRISVDLHGALAPALRRCRTLDELLRLVAKYFCLITPSMMMEYQRLGRAGTLICRPAAGMSQETWRDLMEIHAVSFQMQLRNAVPQRKIPFDIFLSMPSPPHLHRYEALHPARFHFGPMPLPEVRMLFEGSELDSPLFHATPDGAADRALSRLRDDLPRARNWRDWVVVMLRETDGCQPTLGDLAELISVSERTLARRLANEGENFRDLAVATRNRRACDLLADSKVSITQIAYALGFTEPSNFTQAFRKLNGVSPSEFRRTRNSTAYDQ